MEVVRTGKPRPAPYGARPTPCPGAGVQHARKLLERVYGAREDDVVATGGAARGVGLPPGRVLPFG